MNIFPSFVVDKRSIYAKNATHLFLIVPNNSNGIRINRNSLQILLISLCLGITLGVALIPLFETNCYNQLEITHLENGNPEDNSKPISETQDNFQPPKMLRPRFYTTELGLRKKLVAGIILTKYQNYDNLVALNKTLSEFVDQVLFFVSGQTIAQEVKKLGLSGVVTLTSKKADSSDSGHQVLQKYNVIALRAIKYLGEKFSNNYDYFFLGLDNAYINGKVLSDSVKKISISQDVFWGFADQFGECGLENGFVFSRSVIRKLSTRLDRCLSSSTLREGSILKTCFKYSLGSMQCSRFIQGQLYDSTIMEEMENHLGAVSVGPVSSSLDIYKIHLRIASKKESEIDAKIKKLEEVIKEINPRLPPDYQTNSWPIGLPVSHKSDSRFDVLKWTFFTHTHLYPKHQLIAEALIDGTDILDISSVIVASELYLANSYNKSKDFAFQYGYRRFDETRGMEYILDFLDSNDQIYRVECMRPLSKVEMVPMPFVTEGRRVTIVIPLILDSYNETDSILANYLDTERNSNSVVVIAIIVSDLSSKNSKKLKSLKRIISSHRSNQKPDSSSEPADNIKIGHVVINLRQYKVSHYIFAVFDMLSNRILSSNALVLVSDLFVEVQEEFLNRVRMNTILNFQVFSPIYFVEYDPEISGFSSKQLQISKSTGFFDSESFNILSFFIGDYVSARKQVSSSTKLASPTPNSSTSSSISEVETLSRLFLKGSQLHFLRSPDPTLQVRFKQMHFKKEHRKFGSKSQLAKLVLSLLGKSKDNL